MNERYYFTCPIKAAYMNHEFGVITYIELFNEGGIYDKYFIKDWNHRELELDAKNKYHCNKYYVASESEHIFEPKDGDIGQMKAEGARFFVKYSEGSKEWKEWPGGGYYSNKNGSDIIYRDGKHFFNPKEED